MSDPFQRNQVERESYLATVVESGGCGVVVVVVVDDEDVELLSVADDRVVVVVERVVVDVVVVVAASVVELVGGTITEVEDSEVLVGDDEVLWHREVSLFFRLCAKEVSAEKLTPSSLSTHRLHWWSCSPAEWTLASLICEWEQGREERISCSRAHFRGSCRLRLTQSR